MSLQAHVYANTRGDMMKQYNKLYIQAASFVEHIPDNLTGIENALQTVKSQREQLEAHENKDLYKNAVGLLNKQS
jgi:hypothetical protein